MGRFVLPVYFTATGNNEILEVEKLDSHVPYTLLEIELYAIDEIP